MKRPNIFSKIKPWDHPDKPAVNVGLSIVPDLGLIMTLHCHDYYRKEVLSGRLDNIPDILEAVRYHWNFQVPIEARLGPDEMAEAFGRALSELKERVDEVSSLGFIVSR